jgi:hypothetical protein
MPRELLPRRAALVKLGPADVGLPEPAAEVVFVEATRLLLQREALEQRPVFLA